MNELIGIAVFIAMAFGGTLTADKIYSTVRTAALTKSSIGLPSLTSFAKNLTSQNKKTRK